MKIIRFIVGKIILFLDWITTPKSRVRDPKLQEEINKLTSTWAMYQFPACPFCVKVRRFLKRENISIEMKDAKREPHRTALIQNGGKLQVPCLTYQEDNQTHWLYESSDIIAFLQKKLPCA